MNWVNLNTFNLNGYQVYIRLLEARKGIIRLPFIRLWGRPRVFVIFQ